jgi:hypothetical protein
MDDDILKLPTCHDEYPTWGQYFDALEQHMSQRYEITSDDAHISIRMLLAFFRLKRTDEREVLILPQVADWAWHEFITDTENYQAFCDIYFGHYLHHVKARHTEGSLVFLNDRFHATMRVLAAECKTDLDSFASAGWEQPKYRLREGFDFCWLECIDDELVSPAVAAIDVGWIAHRLMDRYGLPLRQSNLALGEYKIYLSKRLCGSNKTIPSVICDIAWKEHILSTVKYHRDSRRLFGSYLHRHA